MSYVCVYVYRHYFMHVCYVYIYTLGGFFSRLVSHHAPHRINYPDFAWPAWRSAFQVAINCFFKQTSWSAIRHVIHVQPVENLGDRVGVASQEEKLLSWFCMYIYICIYTHYFMHLCYVYIYHVICICYMCKYVYMCDMCVYLYIFIYKH